VGLVRLHPREVGSFTLREAVLAVKLELSGDDGVLSPAVKREGSLGEDEGAGIGDLGVGVVVVGRSSGQLGKHRSGEVEAGIGWQRHIGSAKIRLVVRVGRSMPVSGETRGGNEVHGTGVLEETLGVDVSTRILGDGSRSAESMDGVGECINGIGVVEGLGTEDLEQKGVASQRRAVIDVLIGLDDPDELFHGVVEVELDLVTGRTHRLITGELELGDQILVGVLCHSSALVSVQEHVVDVQRGSDQRLIVGNGGGDGGSHGVLTSQSVGGRVGVAVAV